MGHVTPRHWRTHSRWKRWLQRRRETHTGSDECGMKETVLSSSTLITVTMLALFKQIAHVSPCWGVDSMRLAVGICVGAGGGGMLRSSSTMCIPCMSMNPSRNISSTYMTTGTCMPGNSITYRVMCPSLLAAIIITSSSSSSSPRPRTTILDWSMLVLLVLLLLHLLVVDDDYVQCYYYY